MPPEFSFTNNLSESVRTELESLVRSFKSAGFSVYLREWSDNVKRDEIEFMVGPQKNAKKRELKSQFETLMKSSQSRKVVVSLDKSQFFFTASGPAVIEHKYVVDVSGKYVGVCYSAYPEAYAKLVHMNPI